MAKNTNTTPMDLSALASLPPEKLAEMLKQAQAQANATPPTEVKQAAPTTAEAVVDAEPVVVVETEAEEQNLIAATPVEMDVGGFLANVPAGGDVSALLAATEVTESGGGLAWPTLTQTGGPSGGAFEAIRSKSGQHPDLPEGRKPFTAVYLGYRFLAVAWAAGYDSANKTAQKRPVYSAAIPNFDRTRAAQLVQACKGYQFSQNRSEYDFDKSAVGHLSSSSLEILFLDPENGDLFVFRTQGGFNAMDKTRAELLNCATADAQGNVRLNPFVALVTANTEEITTKKGNTFYTHHPKIARLDQADQRAVKAANAFKSFLNTVDQAVKDKVNDWMQGKDAPVTPIVDTALVNGAAMAG